MNRIFIILIAILCAYSSCTTQLVPNCSIYKYREIEEEYIQKENFYGFIKYAEYMSNLCENKEAYYDVFFCIVNKQKNKDLRANNLLDELTLDEKMKALEYLIKGYYSKHEQSIFQVNEYLKNNIYLSAINDSVFIKCK
jgi:hypothetical protein